MANKKRALLVAISSVVISESLPVSAEIEEIIVSARKRDELVLKVPVVESVIGQEQLEQFGVSDIKSASEQIPGLVVGSGTLGFGSQVSLRGIGTSTLNATIDQSVSLNIDGLQMTQGLAYKAGLFDMQSLEVLKGPQALLYGKGSPGGVINIRTAGPGKTFEMMLRESHEFVANQNSHEVVVSGPATDKLGLRVAAKYLDSDGYFKNEAVAAPGTGARDPQYRDFAPQKEWMVRGTALWEQSSDFSALLKINHSHERTEGDGGGLQMASCPDGLTPPSINLGGSTNVSIPFIGGGENCKINKTVNIVDLDKAAFPTARNNGTPFSETNQTFGSLQLDYTIMDDLALSSVTGAYYLDQSSMINGTNSTYAGPMVAADPDFIKHDFTQELRLTSDFRGPLNYMVGAYYQDGSMTYHDNLLGNQVLGVYVGGPTYFPPELNKGHQFIDVNTKSVFGQLIWTLTDQLEIAAGVRWTDEVRKLDVVSTLGGASTDVPVAVPKLATRNYSPELTVTYFLTDDMTVFGSVKQAHKSGSFDTSIIKDPGSNTSFGDEKVTGGEAGIKALLLDRRLRINLATYYNKYSGLQVGANETTNAGAIAIRTLNAADATVKGIDFDAIYQPLWADSLTLRGGLNYNKAKFDNFDNAQCWGGQLQSDGCNLIQDTNTTLANGRPNLNYGNYTAQDLSGRPLMRAPDWTGNLGFNYENPLGQSGMTWVFGMDANFSSKYFTDLTERSDMIQSGYIKTNASLALKGKKDAWELALIGNNLADKLVSGNCVNANLAAGVILGGQNTGGTTPGVAGVDEVQCNVEPGREVWLRLTVQLGDTK